MPRGPLIDVPELIALMATPSPPTLLDVRWEFGAPPGGPAFLAGHIPGASYVDLYGELCGPSGDAGRRPVPAPTEFGAAMRRHGVRADGPVVVYDGADSTGAARAWWLLRHAGHRTVRVLDGGFAAWRGHGAPVETGPATGPRHGDFTAAPGGMPVVDADGAARIARAGVLLDARPAERYRGGGPGDGAGGHIPGAVSAPTGEWVTGQGTFLPADEIRARLHRLGAGAHPVAVYCGSGISATHTVLALAVAGVAAALYPGSWSHWTKDPRRPVATCAAPGGTPQPGPPE
ncbi:sulfurtransferase [Actinomadura graeca]|uniref:Sulfurtransferase n=1 Tax=Actinomadura graeca TaxID=2750812 RepID=A0ABX8QU21_9ACTN|nr:rhodanese-like domain-containing protein [Actinomadura graeca]QXJ22304.1 sulfurtransferase [Actinomadura graeca]